MNAPRHGHTDRGGGGVLIGCVAFALLAFSVSLGGVVYFLTAARSAVSPASLPTSPSYPPPSVAPPTSALPIEPAVDPSAQPSPSGGEGTVISAIDPSAEVGIPTEGPVIGSGTAEVRGSLDRDVIRRVIRRHIHEVRHCYEVGLVNDPNLSGRVTVAFIVDATGAVSSASLADSTFVDSSSSGSVVECILAAVRRWQFPAPEGGAIVGVNYPFVLTTSS